MPKQKTSKSLAKRVKITGTGKLMYRGIGRRHLLSCKSRSRKRRLKRARVLAGCELKRLARLIG